MSPENCYWVFCFQPPATSAVKIFGFAEFVAALALMVLVWTNADYRYRFRTSVAAGQLYRTAFVVMAGIGLSLLAIEVWKAQKWWVPVHAYLSYALWQGICGVAFLTTFLSWIWYAFIKPPVYSGGNAERYARAVHRAILQGAKYELLIVAEEILRSAKNLVGLSFSTTYIAQLNRAHEQRSNQPYPQLSPKNRFAYDILGMIGDRAFCRAVVESAQGTAYELFREMAAQQRFAIPIHAFAHNITLEAIDDPDSFVYKETVSLGTGLIGHIKPLTRTLYGNYLIVSAIDTLFDFEYGVFQRWEHRQWDAYSRLLLASFEDYARRGLPNQHAPVFLRAADSLEHSLVDLQKLDGSQAEWWKTEVHQRLQTVVAFVRESIRILDKYPEAVPERLQHLPDSIFESLAKTIVEIMYHAGGVRGPRDVSWSLHYGDLWAKLFVRHF